MNHDVPDETRPQIEAYWISGCTSCLRMKEFLQSTGIGFLAIDAAATPGVRERLTSLGATVPCTVVGERFAPGLDLAAVAALIGAPHVERQILPIATLAQRDRAIIETLCSLVDPPSPGRCARAAPRSDGFAGVQRRQNEFAVRTHIDGDGDDINLLIVDHSEGIGIPALRTESFSRFSCALLVACGHSPKTEARKSVDCRNVGYAFGIEHDSSILQADRPRAAGAGASAAKLTYP